MALPSPLSCSEFFPSPLSKLFFRKSSNPNPPMSHPFSLKMLLVSLTYFTVVTGKTANTLAGIGETGDILAL